MSNLGKLFTCGKCSSGFKLRAESTITICPKCKRRNLLPGHKKTARKKLVTA